MSDPTPLSILEIQPLADLAVNLTIKYVQQLYPVSTANCSVLKQQKRDALPIGRTWDAEIAKSLMRNAELFLECCSLMKQQVAVDVFCGFSGDDKEVLGGMLQGDKLLNLRAVSACLKVQASKRIGNRFGHSIGL